MGKIAVLRANDLSTYCTDSESALLLPHSKDQRRIDVTIVMPCLNEAKTLPGCIEEAQAALRRIENEQGLIGEIVIGDNGSTDGSPKIACQMGARVINIDQRGYGNALRGGIEAARGRYIVMADSDGSYDFQDAVPMIARLREGYDLVMGSRFKGQILPGAMPWKNRYVGNPILSGVLNLLFHSGLSDAHCGIRGFTKEGYRRMRLESSGMEFASEMVIKATLLNLKRTDVPVTLRPDKRDRPPHLRPWRDGWRHLRYIVMLSPSWLFHIPSLIFSTIGLIILLALMLRPNLTMVDIGPFTFGDHWMIIAGMLLTTSHQSLLLGLATTIYGIQARYRNPGPVTRLLLSKINLERMLLGGVFLIAMGVALLVSVFVSWSAGGFNSLNKLREVFGATTLIMIGVQTFLGGFLLAIVSGNRAEVYNPAPGDLTYQEMSLAEDLPSLSLQASRKPALSDELSPVH